MANVKTYEGTLQADGLKFGLVAARFNDFFVSHLVDGAVDTIVRHGGAAENIELAWVPGSYEIPFAVKKMLASGKYDAIIAMGVVIQGATPHAGYFNNALEVFLNTSASAAEDERADALLRLFRYLRAQAPILPLCFRRTSVLTHADVVDGLSPTAGDPFNGLTDIQINLKESD